MQTTRTNTDKIRPVYLKDPLQRDQGRSQESFKHILNESLTRQRSNKPSGSRLEFTGILNPCKISIGDMDVCHFKLETDRSSLLLNVKGALRSQAKKYLWDEVVVKGHFDDRGIVLEAQSIIPAIPGDGHQLDITESDWELEIFKKEILQNQSIEPSVDDLAS